ncbi:protein kinase domain-containing protein [Morganella morganii]|uniref:protein kinase domain-containing protein n=1 Tax=Morganella morganii TaxID=582 RepID=UPI00277B7FB0|nr:protein kinase [Morganella morganii subsp. morganii]
MDIPDLIKSLKKIKTINTLVGDFYFIKQIGEGGNSNVCLYKKNDIEFAIKFFSKGIDNRTKINRFIDEYFGMAQIPSHPNIADYLHLDTITLNQEKYLIIIMKRYKSTLNDTLADETDKSIYTDKLKSLYNDLLQAIEHLHTHDIIHRDIKPQNILVNDKTGHYVLSDFGISKFDPESFAKEAKTQAGERLANYRYCSPEQRGKDVSISFSSDLYSFAQVIQEYATGDINHGGGRTKVKFQDVEFLNIVDKVIAKCLMHKPEERFNNVAELKNYMVKESEEYKNKMIYLEKQKYITSSWDYLFKLNDAIAKGYPTINLIGEITDPIKMAYFFNCIDDTIKNEEHKNNLWMINSNGGDLNYYGVKHIRENEFEINYGGFLYQARINKILVHYNSMSPYKNYFIILIDSMEYFEYADITDLSINKTREYYPKKVDDAVVWKGHYLDPQDTQNIYVEVEGTVYDNNVDSFKKMNRFIATEALFVSPVDITNHNINQNNLTKTLLMNCIRDNSISLDSARKYWNEIGGHYSSWIINRL